MTATDLSSYGGLVAVFLATLNVCLGLLISVRYSAGDRALPEQHAASLPHLTMPCVYC